MTDPRIRAARPGDGPGCAEIWMDVGRHYSDLDPVAFQVPDAAGLADSFEQDTADADADQLRLIAEVDGAVGGLLVAVLHRPGPRPEHELVRDLSRPRLFVQILAVAERHRRTGVGTALMTAAESWARERGAVTVMLNTYLRSPTSVPFYERRMGYGRRAVVFRKDLGAL
ncbi:GNAT family N-acetyltransferase [Actinoplanes sp. NPDC051513]|uniref:GNAT family N-acetyltransferase n=1 Tax=Actinoplanes sp. NPDC051513 TaxID=3363908 RepID=UPI0037A5DB89